MIAWGSFLLVFVASVAGAGGVVTLFSLGLRLAGPDTATGRGLRALGITCFVVCAALVAFGIYLVIPYFHQ
jgi:hypothetical protein